jgi:transcriptional regulator with XRE-family HTH domain
MFSLKKIREAIGLSQEELAEVLHLSREMVSKMETEKVGVHPRTMATLQNYLVSNSYVLNDDGSITKLSKPAADPNERINLLQDLLIKQQTVRIHSLENLLTDKLVLLEAYLKVFLVEYGHFYSRTFGEPEIDVSKRLVERLRIEIENIQNDLKRYYSKSS